MPPTETCPCGFGGFRCAEPGCTVVVCVVTACEEAAAAHAALAGLRMPEPGKRVVYSTPERHYLPDLREACAGCNPHGTRVEIDLTAHGRWTGHCSRCLEPMFADGRPGGPECAVCRQAGVCHSDCQAVYDLWLAYWERRDFAIEKWSRDYWLAREAGLLDETSDGFGLLTLLRWRQPDAVKRAQAGFSGSRSPEGWSTDTTSKGVTVTSPVWSGLLRWPEIVKAATVVEPARQGVLIGGVA